jgi:hypothetical protein
LPTAAAVVQRYGGTVDKFTGDGIMAVFGPPVALEDHAVRACMAAVGVQEDAKRLAIEVQERGRRGPLAASGPELGSGDCGNRQVDHVGVDEADEKSEVSSDQGKRRIEGDPFRVHGLTLGTK